MSYKTENAFASICGAATLLMRCAAVHGFKAAKNALFLGLCLAIAVLLATWNRSSLSTADSMLATQVQDGELHRYYAGKNRPSAISLDRVTEPVSFSVRLTGRITPVDQQSGRQPPVVQHSDLSISGHTSALSDGTFLDCITINYGWEINVQAHAPQIAGQRCFNQLDPLPLLTSDALHVGQRLVNTCEIFPLLNWSSSELGWVTGRGTAVWAVSELSQKTVAIHSTASGVPLSVQPVECELSRYEVDCFRKSELPRLLRALDTHSRQGNDSIGQLLAGCFPCDMHLAQLRHELPAASTRYARKIQDNLSWETRFVETGELSAFLLKPTEAFPLKPTEAFPLKPTETPKQNTSHLHLRLACHFD